MAKDYDRYEYVVVTISRQLSMVCQETYEAFGWEIYESNRHSDGVQLHMRRPRKIKERSRVMAEQRKMEDALMVIEQCENKKKLGPTIAAIMAGLIGSLFIAIAVWCITEARMIPFFVNQLLGVFFCVVPLWLYPRLMERHKDDYAAEIEKAYEQIEDACKKGIFLTHNGGTEE